MRGRPIDTVQTKVTAYFVVVVSVLGAACQSGDVDLGERGRPDAPTDSGSSGVGGGAGMDGAGMGSVAAGGASNTGGQSGTIAGGGSNQAAGSGGGLAMTDAGGTMAMPSADAAVDESQPSIGCGSEPPISDMTIDVSGMAGAFLIDLPRGYDSNRPYPLIMAFRGAGVSAEDFRGYLDLVSVVGADAIVVNVECLDGAPSWSVERDVPLFDALLLHLEVTYCIDERRIFAVGHATGGIFTSTLGCLRGDKLRAIAPLSGGPPESRTCQGELAVWMTQGDSDVGVAVATGRAGRDFWVDQNGCDASVTTPADPMPCVEYVGCSAGATVRYCEYDGQLGLPDFAAEGLWAFIKAL